MPKRELTEIELQNNQLKRKTNAFLNSVREFLKKKTGGDSVPPEWECSLMLLEEYYKRCFGEAYAPMRTFYNTLYERLWSQYVYSMRNRGFEAEPISSYSVLPKNPRIVLGAIVLLYFLILS